MDEEINHYKNFMDAFYKKLPELKKEFKIYLIKERYFDPKINGFSYQISMGLSFFILELWEKKRHEVLKKILNFIEESIGQNQETDDSIEVLIFEGIMNVIKGRDSDNNTHDFEDFEKLLGQKSINLCRKNEVLWNSLDREPKSLANMIRFLKERNQ
jgi:hypothetical protein